MPATGLRYATRRSLCEMILRVGLAVAWVLVALLPAACADRGAAAGQRVVYLRDGQVWVATIGRRAGAAVTGEALSLPAKGYVLEAALSPDGATVAYLLVPQEALGQAP
ncbi:MAG: hypothetical protein ABFD20_11880, partial [Anaerolineales bacterium]